MVQEVQRNTVVRYALALCLLAFAILINPYFLLAVAGGIVGHELELTNEIICWLLSIAVLLVAGVILLKGRTAEARKRIAFAVAAAILMVILVEVLLQAAVWAGGKFQTGSRGRPSLLSHSAYAEKDWAKQLLTEWKQTPLDYEPFLGWDRRFFKGKFVNIDAGGVRKTWNPEFLEESPREIYMFGGSTMWGAGARDDFTIPSWVSKQLDAAGVNARVHNYGERGYVFLQEIVQLILLLREGQRPDLVVFYDGVNDVYAAYQAGRAGAVQNTAQMRAKLSTPQPSTWACFRMGVEQLIKTNSVIYKAIDRIAAASQGRGTGREVAALYDEDELARLSEDIVRQYGKSLLLLKDLSRIYGFNYICFWQPVSFLEKTLTEEEFGSDPRIRDECLARLSGKVHALLQQKPLDNHIDMVDVLAHRTQSVYFDFCHITEEGNEMVSQRITSAIIGKFSNGTVDKSSEQ
ncbi:MAG: SGNH/GDSL hydrolase family protein [Phycisphaerae bacterium]|nr:SGNH/GDSL hydrolase family protein [Phycisphaerae bacterium]